MWPLLLYFVLVLLLVIRMLAVSYVLGERHRDRATGAPYEAGIVSEGFADGRFTLLPIVCLGDCDHAPVMMIDDDLHHDLEAAKLDGILERYR
jgi:hypothetical protein